MKFKILIVLALAFTAVAGCSSNQSETESTYGDTTMNSDETTNPDGMMSSDTSMSVDTSSLSDSRGDSAGTTAPH